MNNASATLTAPPTKNGGAISDRLTSAPAGSHGANAGRKISGGR